MVRVRHTCSLPRVLHRHRCQIKSVNLLSVRRRSSHLATGVVQQFKHAVAISHHRLSDSSGPNPDSTSPVGSFHSDAPVSPAHSSFSALEPEQNGVEAARRQSGDHVVLDMEGDRTSRCEVCLDLLLVDRLSGGRPYSGVQCHTLLFMQA